MFDGSAGKPSESCLMARTAVRVIVGARSAQGASVMNKIVFGFAVFALALAAVACGDKPAANDASTTAEAAATDAAASASAAVDAAPADSAVPSATP